MKLLLFAFLCGGILAQTPPTTVTVTVSNGAVSKTVTITLDNAMLSGLGCVATTMRPGDSTVCTVTFTQAVLVPVTVSIAVPTGFTAPASVTFPIGASTMAFTLARNATTGAVAFNITPSVLETWSDNQHEYIAGVYLPCCARSDACGLTPDRVSPGPCQ